MNLAMTHHFTISLIVILTFAGCGDRYGSLKPGREGTTRTQWMSRGGPYTNPSVRWFLNFYSEMDQYPRYGIINYNSGPDPGRFAEHDLFVDSLRLCRAQFHTAFRDDAIETWDSSINGFVPFKPKYIAVVVVGENVDSDDKAGAVFEARSVFNLECDLDQLVSSATIKRGNVWYGVEDEDGSYRIVYSFIADHMSEE